MSIRVEHGFKHSKYETRPRPAQNPTNPHNAICYFALVHADSIKLSNSSLGHDLHDFKTCNECLTRGQLFINEVKRNLERNQSWKLSLKF